MITFTIITIISGILAGMGVGGGSIFILLSTIFNILELKEAKMYNLIMFIVAGIFATIFNIKNKNIDMKNLKKIMPLTLIGSIVGIFIIKHTDENLVKNLFYVFMMVIGVYEIISSLINIKRSNNINK